MNTKADYKLAFRVVGNVIKKWDPYGLLHSGAPDDEFDHEIAQVVSQIRLIKSPEDATQAIFAVFFKEFSAEEFPRKSCESVGEELFDGLLRAGLISRE